MREWQSQAVLPVHARYRTKAPAKINVSSDRKDAGQIFKESSLCQTTYQRILTHPRAGTVSSPIASLVHEGSTLGTPITSAPGNVPRKIQMHFPSKWRQWRAGAGHLWQGIGGATLVSLALPGWTLSTAGAQITQFCDGPGDATCEFFYAGRAEMAAQAGRLTRLSCAASSA
jgi:hypothetical protein